MLRRLPIVWALAACACAQAAGRTPPAGVDTLQFVFTSDAHYGIARASFRGAADVSAHIVNQALVSKINGLVSARLPEDGGVNAGAGVGPIDFIVEGGDTANRQEGVGRDAIQPASVSWAQFVADYFNGLTVVTRTGDRAPLYVVPGNHESSNAVGFHKPMTPRIDNTPMVDIYNRMLSPPVPKTPATFVYAKDRVLHSMNAGGVHFVFLQVWPDLVSRAWMERDLAPVAATMPVAIFVHDQPDAEAKHFRNPNGPFTINPAHKFENLLSDTLRDGKTIDAETTIEQRDLEAFFGRHRNITAYFHGNANWNQFYDWSGPDRTAALHVFRVDSPMKGRYSATDERLLSFHVATVDLATLRMTVRECFWNTGPGVSWGASATVDLHPRAVAPHATTKGLRGVDAR